MHLLKVLKTLVLGLIFLLLTTGVSLADELVMQVLNVGQADAILISTAGKRVLIDAGETKTQTRDILKEKGIKNIDLVVATHPHADHIGGMQEVVENFDIKLYIDNGFPHTSAGYNKLMEAAELKVAAGQMKYMVARTGQRLNFGPEAYFEVLSPTDAGFTGTRSDINSNSIILRLQHQNVCFALLGDAEAETERAVMSKLAGCQIYKVSHHGSRHSSVAEFLDVMKPETALISCGLANKHGHPGEATLQRFAERNVKVYRTDLMGELTVVSDGNSYRVTTEHEPIALTKININTADNKALCELPGIGEKTAQSIIDYREANGPYTNINDVLKANPKQVKRLEKILPFITVEGGSSKSLTDNSVQPSTGTTAVAAAPAAQQMAPAGQQPAVAVSPQYVAPPPGFAACIPVAPGTPLPPGMHQVPMVQPQVLQQGMNPAQAPTQVAPAASAAGKVNINTADHKALATMPGMSAKKAQAAIAHREANGPFKSCKALVDVKGIGEKTVEKLLDVCTVQ